ncbi:hypothetical protein [Mesorhizobium sp. PAMC28654]|uniref:hypothetical protein n=1 Tax=Mesorhizobium sp. PAMC28654 TaxID=2880934 RepID=UPI0039B3F399
MNRALVYAADGVVVSMKSRLVACLGASSFTYAEATGTKTLPDWIGSHVRMFRFFGGVPRLIVLDDLKSGFSRVSFYDPEVTSHYAVGVQPARPWRPKDKSKAENGVRFARSCILGRLRNQTFFSLVEVNAAIGQASIASTTMRRLGVSRPQLLKSLSVPHSPALRAKSTNSPNGVWPASCRRHLGVHNAYRIDLAGESMRKQRPPIASENSEACPQANPIRTSARQRISPKNAGFKSGGWLHRKRAFDVNRVHLSAPFWRR